MRDIFRRWKTPRLRGYLVWIPMLPADDLDAAMAQEAVFRDDRVSQYWDGMRALGRQVSKSLELTAPIAWDVYLHYLPGTRWVGNRLPAPNFWMHQLDERPDLLLDPDSLTAEVQKTVEAVDKRKFSQ